MDCLAKGRAGQSLCFFSVSWRASLLYLTHFNSPTCWIPPLSMVAPVRVYKLQHAATFGGKRADGTLLSSYWKAFLDLHIIPSSAQSWVMSINILREGTAACFRFITSGRAHHVSLFALWVCPLAIKMSEIHTFYVIRLACFDKINNLEERRSTNPQAGLSELSQFICAAATYCSLSTYVFGICHTQLNMLLASQSRLMNMRRAKCSFSLCSERPAANNSWNGITSGMNFRSSSSAFNSRSDTPD